MRVIKLMLLVAVAQLFYTCGNKTASASQRFELIIKDSKKVRSVAEKVEISIRSKSSEKIDSVSLWYAGQSLGVFEELVNIELDLSGQPLGERELIASIFVGDETAQLSQGLTLLAPNKATLYTYEILETYPHDPNAYTQGLEFFGDTLYESTGQYKESSLRKVDLATGEVLAKTDLEDAFFGEGITILNDRIYQLTWREKTGFIYDLETLKRKGSFVYGASAEGWGLCNDGERLYKSDGTERIWILDPATLAEKDYVEIYTNTSKIPRVNELEWVDGKIYANIYQKDAIAMVDPKSGAVNGVIDLSDLKKQVEGNAVDVLNGIAYKGEPGILYVTGKNWNKLFKIRVVEK